jgi:hypothetical protein
LRNKDFVFLSLQIQLRHACCHTPFGCDRSLEICDQ